MDGYQLSVVGTMFQHPDWKCFEVGTDQSLFHHPTLVILQKQGVPDKLREEILREIRMLQ
jgi:hypothetical protein